MPDPRHPYCPSILKGMSYFERKLQEGKVFYFSDGCAAIQYKPSRTFELEDYGVEAEWSYFATAHGKGPRDVTVKCLETRASLQRTFPIQTQNPHQLYLFAKL